VFLMKTLIGVSIRQWSLPLPVNLAPLSPALGRPTLMSVQHGGYSSSTPGLVNFAIPNYNALTVTIRGAGGGGTADSVASGGPNATAGQSSQFSLSTPMIATGGLAGIPAGPPANQGGSGPGTVTVGGGGAGGLGLIVGTGATSTVYAGSAGGRITKNWNRTDAGAPVPGTVVGLLIGRGGSAALPASGTAAPQSGQNGSTDITWS
jgi:hypothetical protein